MKRVLGPTAANTLTAAYATGLGEVLHSPWNLPIKYEVEGGKLVGSIELQVGVKLDGCPREEAEKFIAAAIKNAILAENPQWFLKP